MGGDALDGCLGILRDAAEIVAQRRQQYGPPAEHFQQVARRWSLTIGTAVRPEQVLLCQLDLKLARLAHEPGHRDSLVDLIGYSVLLHELLGDASAEGPAEIAEVAEHDGCAGAAAAEAPLKGAEVRRSAGWREFGILVVAEQDPRLTWAERMLVRQLGARLYGQRRVAPNG